MECLVVNTGAGVLRAVKLATRLTHLQEEPDVDPGRDSGEVKQEFRRLVPRIRSKTGNVEVTLDTTWIESPMIEIVLREAM